MLMIWLELKRQPHHGSWRHNAERFDLQLAGIEVVAEANDERVAGENILRQKREQVAARGLFAHAVIGQDEPLPLGVLRNVAAVYLSQLRIVDRVDRLLIGERALELRLDVFDDGGEVPLTEAADFGKVVGARWARNHPFPANSRVGAAGVKAQLLHLGDLEKAIVALD